MEGPNSLGLAANAETEGLACILVGGNAVNLYAYLRTTFDVDLLIRETDRTRWTAFFADHGYEIFHATTNFIRLRFAADPAGALPVDLMLADESTFQKIQTQSRVRDLGSGHELRIPAPLHLIAMKLHALRNPQRLANGVDLQDVRHLIKTEKLEVNDTAFIELLDRYASTTVRDQILKDIEDAPPAH